jgi:hypothetical protein
MLPYLGSTKPYFNKGAVVEDVRTVFERKNDATVYISSFYPTLELTTS